MSCAESRILREVMRADGDEESLGDDDGASVVREGAGSWVRGRGSGRGDNASARWGAVEADLPARNDTNQIVER